ncbi:hypothetical protein [Saguinine gammaherpesvirus 1]|uniref:Uncharacterized protein n=1 Tax=Saguinine gammaherpesvirus 1 TaxID=2169901 RepID=A0A9Q8VJC4_9GAMA|nr:hypothetical protein [Saguinine gammaherpesvirus 1]
MLFSLCLFSLLSPISAYHVETTTEKVVSRTGHTALGEIEISAPTIPDNGQHEGKTTGCDVVSHGTTDMFSLQTGEVGFVFPVSLPSPLSFCANGQLIITGEWQCPKGQEDSPEDIIIMGVQNIPYKFNVSEMSLSNTSRISAKFPDFANGAITFMSKTPGPLGCIKNLLFNFSDETPVSFCAHWIPNFRTVEDIPTDNNDPQCSWATTVDSKLLVDCVTMTIHQNISEKFLYGAGYTRELTQKESILNGILLRDTHYMVWIWTYQINDSIWEVMESGPPVPKLVKSQDYDVYSLTLPTVGLASKSPSLALVRQMTDTRECLGHCTWLLTGPEPSFQKRGSCNNFFIHWSGHDSSVFIHQRRPLSGPKPKTILLQIFNHAEEDVVLLDL